MNTGFDFLIRKDALSDSRFDATSLPGEQELEPGQALLHLDQFALTANNITYAAFGEAMHYWDFFPAPAGWGRLPVWGFADVAAEKQSGLSVGERIFGFWPISTGLVVNVGQLTPSGFEDVSAHRAPLPAVYNRYTRAAGDPGYVKEIEALQMIFRPLFMTDFLLDDFIADNNQFGASQVLLSSASSKTAYGLAFLMSRRSSEAEIVGLTSPGNVSFVESLGCYTKVVSYDGIASLDPNSTALYVDFAGSGEVRKSVHGHWQNRLAYSCAVGGTHWQAIEQGVELPGPTPELFFAPAQMKKRLGEWGGAELQVRYAECWKAFAPQAAAWTEVVKGSGQEAIQETYRKMLEGGADPRQGYVLSC